MASTSEIILEQASLAVELVDELSSGELIGASRVSVFRSTAPNEPMRAVSFLSNGSRWVFEGIATAEEALVRIEADNYFPEQITTGDPEAKTLADPDGLPIPSLLTIGDEIKLVQIRLRPHMGYPFASSLTRVVGSVLVDGMPFAGGDVQVTPRYVPEGNPPPEPVPGTPVFRTLTDSNGQFVAWLFPNNDETSPAPASFDVVATAGSLTETKSNTPLIPRTINGVTFRMKTQTLTPSATGVRRARSSRRKRCLNC